MHNSKLPGQGGVFNAINLNLYHYAGNNPMKYVDPNGKAIVNPLDYFLFWLSNSGSSGKLLKLHYDAGMGDQNAQYMVKTIWYEASVQACEDVGDGADYAAMACLAIGFPEGVAAAKIIGTSADFAGLAIKFARAMETDDYSDFMSESIIQGSSFIVGAVISKKVAKISIKIGENGLFYQLGRRDALKKWEGIKKKMIQDLAPEVGGKIAEEITKKVYEQIKPILNEDK